METVTIKIDKEVKKIAEKQARMNGVPLSSFIASIFTSSFSLKTAYRAGETFNIKTTREMDRIMKDIKEGKNLSPVFKNTKDMKAYLEK
jgi:hypothetical protein